MKKLLPVLFILIITSCSKEVPSNQLVERGDVVYEVNSKTPFTGSSVTFFYNGQLKEKINYKSGKEDGLKEEYYENGQLQVKTNYKNGKEDGLKEEYHENGQLKEKINYISGKEDGPYLSYHTNGQLDDEGNFKDGIKDGPWIGYYDNGSFYSKGSFVKGKKHGVFEKYYSDGEQYGIETYKNGLLDGPTTYEMERLFFDYQFVHYSVINYKDGELHGLVESCHSIMCRKIKNRVHLKEGKLDGTFESFDEDGQLIRRTCHQDGKEVEMSYCY